MGVGLTRVAPPTDALIINTRPGVSADAISKPASQGVFVTLHGVRGIAAIAVVAWHEPELPCPTFQPASGYLAVDLFFVLSGLVLAHAYDARFARGLSAGRFMIGRLIRLYPLYLVGLVLNSVGLLVAFSLHTHTNWTLAEFAVASGLSLFFIPSPPMHSTTIFPLNGPAWSLFFELVANLAFALIWKRLTIPVLAVIIAVAALLLIGADIQHGSLDVGSNWPTFWGGLPRVIYSFFVGVVLGRAQGTSLPRPTINPWLIILAVAIVLSVQPGAWRAEYDLGCVLILLPLLVWAGASVEPRGTTAVFFTALGASSYAMYAVHVPLLTMAAKGLGPQIASFGAASAVIFLVAMVGVGLLLDRVDGPVRARLNRLVARAYNRRRRDEYREPERQNYKVEAGKYDQR
ncbi:MAG: acyltransferase [Acetobacteraceae bacterium]